MLRLVVAIVVLVSPVVAFAEDLNALLSYVPKDANAVLAVDLKALMSSPMAAKEGWKKKITEDTMVGILPFPDTAEYAVIAELLQPGTLQGKWELVLISTSKPYSLPDIAKSEKAEIEAIGSTPVCFTRRNTVILQLSPTLLGIYSPGHRQDVARWLKGQTGKPQLAAPLAKAVDVIKAGNQVALIFDFEDTLEASKVKQFIAAQKEVQEKKLNVESLSKVFSSITSVTFALRAEQTMQASMKVEFNQDVGNQVAIMHSLVLNAFDMIGGDVDEYRKGTVTQTAKAFEVQTTLTPLGIKNTIGMIQPHSIAPPMAKKTVNGKEENDPVKQAQQTFRSIQSIANSARDQAERSNNIARAMVIYDNAATKLDKLPVSHVDEDLQRFAADVAKSLREMATELNTGVLEVQTLETKIRTDVNVTQVPPAYIFPNPWGFRFFNPMLPTVPQYNVQTNQAEVIAAQQDALTRAIRKHNEVWRALIDKSAALKKALAVKYGVAF